MTYKAEFNLKLINRTENICRGYATFTVIFVRERKCRWEILHWAIPCRWSCSDLLSGAMQVKKCTAKTRTENVIGKFPIKFVTGSNLVVAQFLFQFCNAHGSRRKRNLISIPSVSVFCFCRPVLSYHLYSLPPSFLASFRIFILVLPFGSIFFLLAHSLKMCLELLCKRAENSGIEFAVSCKNAAFSRISHSVGTLILKKYPVTASTRWRSFNSLSLFFRVRCWLFLMLRCNWENQSRKEYRWNKDKEKERTCDRKNFRLFQQRLLQQINVIERASDWLIDVQVQQFFLIIV